MSKRPSRLSPRFSLQTLLLLGTIAALGITLWRNGKDVVPLRAELMDLRKELGYFRVDQPDRIVVQESDVVTSKAWRWRVYLPQTCRLHYLTGEWDEVTPGNKQELLSTAVGKGNSFEIPHGQYTLDISLEDFDGDWFFRHSYKNEVHSSTPIKVPDNWLRDLLIHNKYSDTGLEPVTFDRIEPVILVHLRRKKTTRDADGKLLAEAVAGPADNLLIWITHQ